MIDPSGYSCSRLYAALIDNGDSSPPYGGDSACEFTGFQKGIPVESGLANLTMYSPSRPQPRISLTIFSR